MQAINLFGHQNPIYSVVAHPKQLLCYTAGNDKGIVEWNLKTLTFSRLFNEVNQTIYCLEIIEPLNIIASGCMNGDINFYDIATTQLLFNIKTSSAIFCLKYNPLNAEIIASSDNGKIYIISVKDQLIVFEFNSGNEKIRNLDISKNRNLLITGSNDNYLRIYQLNNYEFINQIEAHTLGVSAVAFSIDAGLLISGSKEANVKIWDRLFNCTKEIAAHLFPVYEIAIHPTMPYFATCSRDKSIKIWRIDDFSLFKNLSLDKNSNAHQLSVNKIDWSFDGQLLLSVSDDKLLKVWQFL